VATHEKILHNYVGGEWLEVVSSNVIDVQNPATGKVLCHTPISNLTETTDAVKIAKNAFDLWRNTPLSKRIEYLSNLRNLLIRDSGEIASLITLEHGKVLKDSMGEMQRTIENATKSLDIELTHGKLLTNIAAGRIDEYSVRVPMGVFCAITPFNFPAMIVFWFLPYAVASGNTFIVKPSEQTPMTMDKIFELIHEAGFPKGVINLLHGNVTVVDHLLTNPDIVGISSVGSTPAMKAIWGKATQNGKRAQCQGGAKNSVVVLSDIDPDKIIPHIIDSFYGNTGQRCLAGGNLIVVGHSNKQFQILLEKLISAAKDICVGSGFKEDITMGPVISNQAKEKIISCIDRGVKESAHLILDGRSIKVKGYLSGNWLGPSIFTNATPDMAIVRDEIFGPVMPIIRSRDLDGAIRIINASDFGNAAMLFTSNGRSAQKFEYEVQSGNIGVNIGLPAPIPPFPFGGMKNSFRGDLHGQGEDSIRFFTQEKVVIKRWL